jgi:hypothetical protein
LLDQKVTKNQGSSKASLPHLAFTLQIRQNLGCKTLPYFVRVLATASANIAMPLQPHSPPSFCLISAEAVLLTAFI